MVNFQDTVIRFSVVMILVFSVMMFITTIQDKDNATDKISNNSIFNDSLGDLRSEINDATTEASEKYDVFNTETPQPGFGSIVMFGIVSIGKTFSTIIFGFFTAIIKLPLVVLGIPATIYNILIVQLVIIITIGAWILYKLGG